VEVVRPDATQNRQANRAYAEAYATSHRLAGDSLEARLAVEDLILLDGLLRDYRLLDVGCGTGGYLRFLKNHRRVTGLDFSAPTIDQARELQSELGIERVDYVVAKFEDFDSEPEAFDAVRLRGTFGAYQPWPASLPAIDTTQALLRPGGIAIASYFPPPGIVHKLKSRMFPRRTLAIAKGDFERIWKARGFQFLFDIGLGQSVVTFWRKPHAARSSVQ
jgi:SAM-dependent methyltransferase